MCLRTAMLQLTYIVDSAVLYRLRYCAQLCTGYKMAVAIKKFLNDEMTKESCIINVIERRILHEYLKANCLDDMLRSYNEVLSDIVVSTKKISTSCYMLTYFQNKVNAQYSENILCCLIENEKNKHLVDNFDQKLLVLFNFYEKITLRYSSIKSDKSVNTKEQRVIHEENESLSCIGGGTLGKIYKH